jgi:hypothetical protein
MPWRMMPEYSEVDRTKHPKGLSRYLGSVRAYGGLESQPFSGNYQLDLSGMRMISPHKITCPRKVAGHDFPQKVKLKKPSIQKRF